MDECVGVVREFSKEEVVMSETRRMAEEAKRFGEEVQEQTQKMGREYRPYADELPPGTHGIVKGRLGILHHFRSQGLEALVSFTERFACCLEATLHSPLICV